MSKLCRAILGVCLCMPVLVYAVDDIIMWNRNFDKAYHLELVNLALQLTQPEYGEYRVSSSQPLEQGRVFADLDSAKMLNLAIAGISSERERLHEPIYIPVDRGLLGFRVCLVNNGRVSFEKINVLTDFRKHNILIGVGTHWPDKLVYESNGLQVLSSPLYENLFDMLEKRRFDCLPRSINELDMELKQHAAQDFVAEQRIALLYPSADFIFVSKGEQRIKARLTLGLEKAIQSGEFQALFRKYYSDVMVKYGFYNRKLLILENTHLSDKAREAINRHGVASFLISN